MAFDFLTQQELAMIRGDLTAFFADTQLSPTITYRAFVSRSFTPSTGAYSATYTNSTIGATRNEMPSREVQASDGLYKMGDLRFIINRQELASEPTKEDQIVDGAATYDLVSWDSDPIAQLWRIVARKA